MTVEAGVWFCVGLVAYIYVGYPILAALIAQVVDRHVFKAAVNPSVTVVISAFNEERDIDHTIRNKLEQNYPPELLSIIVVSDESTDRTDEIVESISSFSPNRVTLLRQKPRQGKTQALNLAISQCTSEIVVFSDANSLYEPSAVRAIVRNFADPTVGYVTGRMVYTNPTKSGFGEGAGTYMGYENILRSIETRLGSVVGADGGIDAVRRELYRPMRADQLPDFVLPLSIVEQGRRVVYESEAMLYEPSLARASDEFRMRVRVSLRALWAIHDKRCLLNPLRYPIYSWQLFSHKVLRYAAFVPLGGLFVLTGIAANLHPYFRWLFVAELIGLTMAGLGHLLKESPGVSSKLLVPYYFLVLNVACLFAFWKYLRGEKMALWKPRTGA
ncbi:MAG: glycosyltransferase family 2 protein [Sterolibacteriaceae bacterium]|nr:glycosyltransferase family 2 protein [Sterolibacteriaceae bacterium]